MKIDAFILNNLSNLSRENLREVHVHLHVTPEGEITEAGKNIIDFTYTPHNGLTNPGYTTAGNSINNGFNDVYYHGTSVFDDPLATNQIGNGIPASSSRTRRGR